jgi:hypothetical protein
VWVLAAVFFPLIRAAVVETHQLRTEGIELPSYPVTRKSLISAAVITVVLWIIFWRRGRHEPRRIRVPAAADRGNGLAGLSGASLETPPVSLHAASDFAEAA